MTVELSAGELKDLFFEFCRALTFDELRLKPREKQLALLLALESFGEGSESGAVDMDAWRLRLAKWRSNELETMLDDWRRAGWLAVDVTEGSFRLAPDRLAGWANVQVMRKSEVKGARLNLRTEDDLHKTFAKISQNAAAKISQADPRVFTKISQVAKISQNPERKPEQIQHFAKISQSVTKISQPSGPFSAKISQNGGLGGNVPEGNVSETFNVLNVKRLNVSETFGRTREACENFANYENFANALMDRVRVFVGDADWSSPDFWKSGRGWIGELFLKEGDAMESALNYCEAGLKDKNSRVHVKKSRGAMLWNEFQRMRRDRR